MRKKKIITSIVIVICVLVGSFFIMRFDVLGRINNVINKPVVENKAESMEKAPEKLRYEIFLDKDGNESVVEYRKQILTDLITGEEVEIWEDTAEDTIIYNNTYEGRIQKIEDNKIYFMVDMEIKEDPYTVNNVKDYQVVFDIDTYDFESDPRDFLSFHNGDLWEGEEYFYSADGMEFLVGGYLSVQAFMNEDPNTRDSSKTLFFQPSSRIKSFLFSLFF